MPYKVLEKLDGKWGIYKVVLDQKILVGESSTKEKADASVRIREQYLAEKKKS
jgi:hypothetical protein